jgi:hypothetical protein
MISVDDALMNAANGLCTVHECSESEAAGELPSPEPEMENTARAAHAHGSTTTAETQGWVRRYAVEIFLCACEYVKFTVHFTGGAGLATEKCQMSGWSHRIVCRRWRKRLEDLLTEGQMRWCYHL